MSECVVYLACAPKSNSTYMAINNAERAISGGDMMEVPYHLRNDGEGYVYPHSFDGHWVAQQYLPEIRRFYIPGKLGAESRIAERLKKLWKRFCEE